MLPFGCVVKNIFESVDETLKCYHSNESYWAVLSCGTVYYAVQGGSNFWVLCCIRWLTFLVCGWKPKVWPFKWKPLSSIIRWYWLLCCTKVALTFESLGEILQCDHSKESLLSSSFLWYCLLCIIWFISKSIRLDKIRSIRLSIRFISKSIRLVSVVLFIIHHLIHLKINKIFFYLCHIYFIFRSAITHLQYAVIVKSKLNQQKWWN